MAPTASPLVDARARVASVDSMRERNDESRASLDGPTACFACAKSPRQTNRALQRLAVASARKSRARWTRRGAVRAIREVRVERVLARSRESSIDGRVVTVRVLSTTTTPQTPRSCRLPPGRSTRDYRASRTTRTR